jgi:hypothetical protein
MAMACGFPSLANSVLARVCIAGSVRILRTKALHITVNQRSCRINVFVIDAEAWTVVEDGAWIAWFPVTIIDLTGKSEQRN